MLDGNTLTNLAFVLHIIFHCKLAFDLPFPLLFYLYCMDMDELHFEACDGALGCCMGFWEKIG
jgi:hypothetical protein